ILRGHSFVSLYLNPAYMNDERWAVLASIIKWARTNADMLLSTQPLLPESWLGGKVPKFTAVEKMPREPYGYAHWKNGRGLVLLRNPWIEKALYRLKIDVDCFRKIHSKQLSVVSLYPEPRLYAQDVRPGDIVEVWLAPYETVVLSIDVKQPTDGLADARQMLAGAIKSCRTKHETKRVELEGFNSPLASQLIDKMGNSKTAIEFCLSSDIEITAPKAELLILIEYDKNVPPYASSLEVNGAEAAFSTSGSDTGWSASWMTKVDNWVFLRAPISPGKSSIDAKLLIGDNFKSVSAWIWAMRDKPAVSVGYPNLLPSPEIISLDSCVVLPVVTVENMPVASQD
ncbi:MAG: hypothetical protein N3B12_00130, partial [Armatimonadetes bacterium]|nr:hypothetical protein [Armatimonadota bacterium]